jgi:hypothetical protein
MKRWVLILALTLAGAPAFAQQRDGRGAPGKNQGMTQDQRQRMRNDMQDVYRDRRGPGGGQERPPQQRQLTPQEREQLRRDINDANRNLKR